MAIDRKISDLNPYPGDPQDGDLFITAREDSSNFKISFFDLSRDLTDRVSTFYLTGDQAVDGKKQFIQSIDADIDGNAETVTNGVYLIGDQTINGRKKFLLPITGDLSGVAKYVVNGVYITGGQIIGGNKKFLNAITGDLSGIARYVQDGAYITGNQTIEGIKTFNEFLNANVSGNLSGTARYVQHGVYVTGNQEISGIKTFKSFVNANVSGNLSGTSRYVEDGVYLTGNQTIQGEKTFGSFITSNISGNLSGTALYLKSGVYTSGNQTIEGEKDFIGRLLVSGSDVITNESAKDFLRDDAILLSNVDQISSGNKVFKGRIIPSGGITSTGNKPLHFTDGRSPSNFSTPDKSLTLAFQNGVYVSGGADLRVEGKIYAEEIEAVESIVGDEGPMVLTDGRDPSNFVGPDKSLSLAFQNGVYVSGGADLRVEGKVYAEEIETIENIVGDEGPMVFTDGRDPSNFIGPDKSLSLAFQSGVYITGSSSLNVEGSGIFYSGVNISGDVNISGRTNVNDLIVHGNINAKTLSVGEVVAYNYIYSSFRQSTSDDSFYIPLHVGEGAEETATPTQVEKGIAILCPRKGKISRIIFKQKGGGSAGNVSFAIQTSADYEQLGTSLVDQEVSSTQTVDKDIPYIYNFSNSQHFNSGNALFLNVRRSSNSVTNGDWVITAEVLYTID